MKYIFLILFGALLLSSCTHDNKTLVDQNSASGTTQSWWIPGTYKEDLEKVSWKISESDEFKNCMNMNVPMCIQSAGMQLAQKEKSTAFCMELLVPEQQESCIFVITMMNARERWDIKLCETLNPPYLRQCKVSIIRSDAIAKKDPKLCNPILWLSGTSVADSDYDDCMIHTLMEDTRSTPASCDIILDKQVRTVCTNMLQSRNPTPTVTPPQKKS